MIVFFTFVVREEVREHFRGVAASIESAQAAFSIEEGFRRLEKTNKTLDQTSRQHAFSSMQELIDSLHNPSLSVTIKQIGYKENVVYDTYSETHNYVDSHHTLSNKEIQRILKENDQRVASLELTLNGDIDNFAQVLNEEAYRARNRADFFLRFQSGRVLPYTPWAGR